MPANKECLTTSDQLSLPVLLISLCLLISFSFQTYILLHDHSALAQTRDQQEKLVQEAQRVKTQVDALALGTLKLSQQGNKDAGAIIKRMKDLGINVGDNQPAQAGGAAPAGQPGQ
jgi:hypothetical protein